MKRIEHPDDQIVEEAVREMIERSAAGIKKFKCTMAEADMDVRQALLEARQEAMDQVVYLSKAIYEYDRQHGVKPIVEPKIIKCKCANCVRK